MKQHKIGLGIAFGVALGSAAPSFAQQAVQWRVEDGGNGHWYRLATNELTDWPTARKRAVELGGHLATFQSAAEWGFIYTRFDGQNGYWIGLFQDPPVGLPAGEGWRWVTDEPLDFTAWCPGEPNDWWGYQQWIGASGNACWDDTLPQGAYVPIIEWSADCNGDGIVDYGQCRDGSLPDYDGDNIPDCCEAGTPCIVGNYPVQWRVEDGGNGHWYQRLVPATPVTWTEAMLLCEGAGGHLATLPSAAEYAFVRNIIGSIEAYLGGLQSANSCEPGCGWQWLTGEPWIYTSWNAFEPNNSNAEQDFLRTYSNGNWDDIQDDYPFPFGIAIEWSSDCNGDGIVDYGQILPGQLADTDSNGIPDICEVDPCPGDVTDNGVVDGVDLSLILALWGTSGQKFPRSDANNDGTVDANDLAIVLSGWGDCP